MQTVECCMAVTTTSSQRGGSFLGRYSSSKISNDEEASDLSHAREVDKNARLWVEQASKAMPVLPIDAQSLPEPMRLKALRVRAWRQRRRDMKLLESFETVYPEVRVAEENIRHSMQSWIDDKHKRKKKLKAKQQELQTLPVMKDDQMEERSAFLRQCIEELTDESGYAKKCISFWEEILRHRRLEAISKGLSYLSWANKENASHPNADPTLVQLYERLTTLRHTRQQFMRQLTLAIHNREGEHAAEKILSQVTEALHSILNDDDSNEKMLKRLSVPCADSTVLSDAQCTVLEQIRKEAIALHTCVGQIQTYTDTLLQFVNLREDLLIRKSEIEARAEECLDTSSVSSWGSEEDIEEQEVIS